MTSVARPKRIKTPIFIIGPVRSGTTLLRWALDSHPNIVCRSEQNFLRPLIDTFKQEFLSDPVGNTFDQVKLARLKHHHAMQTPPTEIARRFRRLHESFYLDLCKHLKKNRWADNTHVINDYMFPVLDIIYEHTPVYLMLTRHGLDVALSSQEKFGGIFSDHIKYWCGVTTLQLSFLNTHPGRCFMLRYEDLVMHPQDVLDKVFGFLHEDPIKDVENRIFSREHGPHFGDHKIGHTSRVHTKSVNKWRSLPNNIYGDTVDSCHDFREIMLHVGYQIK